MPRDFLPAIYPNDDNRDGNSQGAYPLYNCVPQVLQNGEVGANPRRRLLRIGVDASASTDRGRGLIIFGGHSNLYLTEDRYYYNGGYQDLTATTGNGYAGNTGFNEEYLGSHTEYLVSGVNNLVIVNAGHTSTHASAKHGNIWYVAAGNIAPSSISDADLPCNNGVSITRGGASLDGYFFIADITGKIYNSDLNDITAWSGDFLTAEREPDTGIYLGKHHDHVVYIGTKSIEFFYNAGNASGSPLSRRQDVSYSVGCYYPNSITAVGDTIYFVGTDHAGWSKVYQLENFQLSVVSSPKVEAGLSILSTSGSTYPDLTSLDSLVHDVWMVYATMSNSAGLILTGSSNFTLYWHGLTNNWSAWSYGATVTYVGGIIGVGNWSNNFPLVSFNRLSGTGSTPQYQLTNGVICYEALASNSEINDLAVVNDPDVFMQFQKWDAGTDRKKRINWVRVITEPSGSDDASRSPLNIELRWYDFNKTEAGGPAPPDDYNAGRTVDLNVRGAKVARLGTTRERHFLLDWTVGHGAATVVKGLEIDYEIVGE